VGRDRALTKNPAPAAKHSLVLGLVLSRKVGEKLVIDGNITVEVVRIQGNRITLGLVAPANVKILRGEQNQKQVAGQVDESQGVSNAEQLLRQAC